MGIIVQNNELVVGIAGNARWQATKHFTKLNIAFLAYFIIVQEEVILTSVAHEFSINKNVGFTAFNFSGFTQTIYQIISWFTSLASSFGDGNCAILMLSCFSDADSSVCKNEALRTFVAF